MIEAPARSSGAPAPVELGRAPDERAARHALRGQIERLERDLAALAVDAWPRADLRWTVPGVRRRPRPLDLGELERVRDALAARVVQGRAELAVRHEREQDRRALVADMLRAPERHRWRRVSNADIGEPGCHHWHVVPRWGIVGALASWWRVKISSGCP